MFNWKSHNPWRTPPNRSSHHVRIDSSTDPHGERPSGSGVGLSTKVFATTRLSSGSNRGIHNLQRILDTGDGGFAGWRANYSALEGFVDGLQGKAASADKVSTDSEKLISFTENEAMEMIMEKMWGEGMIKNSSKGDKQDMMAIAKYYLNKGNIYNNVQRETLDKHCSCP